MKKSLFGLALTAFFAFHGVAGQITAEEAVRQYQSALNKGQISALLGLLPPSYIQDATALVNDFGSRMDAELWTKLRDMLGKASTTLAPKAELFVDMAGKEEPPAPAVRTARANAVREALRAVGTLVGSDVMQLERLKTVDAEAFAKEISAAFTASTAAFQKLKSEDPTVPEDEPLTVIKSETLPSGNVALTFAGEDGQAGDTEEFTQVEGRWVPAEMAGSWAESVASAQAGLSKLNFATPEGQQQKAQFLMVLNMLDPMLQQLGTAQTAEQLQQMAGGLMMPLLMMGGGMGGGGDMGVPAQGTDAP